MTSNDSKIEVKDALNNGLQIGDLVALEATIHGITLENGRDTVLDLRISNVPQGFMVGGIRVTVPACAATKKPQGTRDASIDDIPQFVADGTEATDCVASRNVLRVEFAMYPPNFPNDSAAFAAETVQEQRERILPQAIAYFRENGFSTDERKFSYVSTGREDGTVSVGIRSLRRVVDGAPKVA